jgi:hypothetical protein
VSKHFSLFPLFLSLATYFTVYGRSSQYIFHSPWWLWPLFSLRKKSID